MPNEFQYFGAWILLCFVLNGYFGLRLLATITADRSIRSLAACFFILSPPLLLRGYGHESLMAQWLLLAGMVSYQNRWNWKPWLSWCVIAALCHPYILVMVLGLAAAAASTALWIDRSHSPRTLFCHAAGISVALYATMWLSGYFCGTGQLAGEGYGYYSMNVLALIDPLLDWSRFLKQGPIYPDYAIFGNFGQYEGFLYLGAGMLFLSSMAIALYLKRATPTQSRQQRWLPLIAVAGLFWLLALSNKIIISDIHLVTIPLPDPILRLLSIFRSSGRFGWIAFYLINLAVISCIATQLPRRAAGILLVLALSLQIADQSLKYKEFRQMIHERAVWQTPLKSARWDILAGSARKLMIAPPHPPMQTIYIPFAHLASRHRLQTNAAHLARPKKGDAPTAAIPISPDTLYVFPDAKGAEKLPEKYKARLEVLDGFTVLLPE